jgi:hypothetical protein
LNPHIVYKKVEGGGKQMDKKPLIGVSLCAVVLLVLGSLTNVVGYQTIQSSNQNLIKERINQKELLFKTIVDIVNNKEIQRVILKSQMSRGIFPTSEFSVVTKHQLQQMYIFGLMFSKIISTSRIHSMIKQYQLNSKGMQKEINAIIEKDSMLKGEITQLSNLECDCKNENATRLGFTIICSIYFILIIPIATIAIIFIIFNDLAFFQFQNNPILHSIFVSINALIEVLSIFLFLVGVFLNCESLYP